MNICGFARSLSSKMPSYQSMSKLGFGVMGALSPVFAGMAVKAAGSGSYLQSGVCALTAIAGPALMKNMESLCKKAWSSIFYTKDLSSEILDVSQRASAVGHRIAALLPTSNEPSAPFDAGALVKRVDRSVALLESTLDKVEWMSKNPVETMVLALCAVCSYRALTLIAFLYGLSEMTKKKQLFEVA